MRIARLLLAIAFTTLPIVSHAQAWAEAYRDGDYETAVALLQPIVADLGRMESAADPEPARVLAQLYAEGRGVPADPALACGLALTASMAAQQESQRLAYSVQTAYLEESRRFVDKYCEWLSPDERQFASRIPCYAFGVPETTLLVGTHTVHVSRRGLWLDGHEPVEWMCAAAATIQATTVPPPADAAPGVVERHFIEVFAWWIGHLADQSVVFGLSWEPFEVRADGIVLAHRAPPVRLLQTPTRPVRFAPLAIERRPSLEMIRSGHIRWTLDDTPLQRGWLMLPEEESR